MLIRWSDESGTWATVGVSENVVEASWKALLDAARLDSCALRRRGRCLGKGRGGRRRVNCGRQPRLSFRARGRRSLGRTEDRFMSKDKIEGFMIGLGARSLIGAFMKFGEAPAKHAGEAIASRPVPVSVAPTKMTVRAARHVRAFAAETAFRTD